MIIFLPVMFYSMMGFIFAGNSYSQIQLERYSIGYINFDLNGEEPINEMKSIKTITDLFSTNTTTENVYTNTTVFKEGINYTVCNSDGSVNHTASLEKANKDLKEGKIAAYITFHEGFQKCLNEHLITSIAFLSNTTEAPERANALIQGFSDMHYFETENLTQDEFKEALNNCSKDMRFDYFISIEENITLRIYHRNAINNASLTKFLYQFQALSLMILNPETFQTMEFTIENSSEIKIITIPLDCGTFPLPSYTIYFMQSIDPITQEMIANTIEAVITNIINYDPDAIVLNRTIETVSGIELNSITIGTPGYLMYGLLGIMSFATSMLAGEAHEGLLKRLKSSKLRDFELLMGNFIANTVVIFVQFIIGLSVLALFGWNPYISNLTEFVIGIILNLIAISLIINSLSFLLVPIFKSPEAAAGGVWIILIPLMTLSGAFFPLEIVAPSLVGVSKYIPTRMSVLVFQALMVDGMGLSDSKVFVNLIGQFLYGILFFALGVYGFKNFIGKIFERGSIKEKKETKE